MGRRSNQELADTFSRMAELYRINGVPFKPAAYERAASIVRSLEQDAASLYRAQGVKGLQSIKGVGKSIAGKIEEYVRKGRIKAAEELEEKTALREITTHFFETKGVPLGRLKAQARKRAIVYGHYAKRAKELLELAGSVREAKKAIDKVAAWANSRNLDYTLETVAKRWLELDRLKPKEVIKKPFYRGDPMVWSETRKKWFVVTPESEWLEFADTEDQIEWRIVP